MTITNQIQPFKEYTIQMLKKYGFNIKSDKKHFPIFTQNTRRKSINIIKKPNICIVKHVNMFRPIHENGHLLSQTLHSSFNTHSCDL